MTSRATPCCRRALGTVLSRLCWPPPAVRKKAAAPPMATPSVTLSRDKVPLGGPVDITYKFVVAADAKFTQNYRVMVHVVDPNEELMWTDDHDPPIADERVEAGADRRVHADGLRARFIRTSARPRSRSGCTRSRTSPASRWRRGCGAAGLPSRRACSWRRRARPCSRSSRTAGTRRSRPSTTRRSSGTGRRRSATLAVRNPKKDSVLYLELDNPGGIFDEPQQVTVSIGAERCSTSSR